MTSNPMRSSSASSPMSNIEVRGSNQSALQMRSLATDNRDTTIHHHGRDLNPGAELLRLWRKTNEKGCPKAADTFVDDEGVQRYISNWRPVTNGQEKTYDLESGSSRVYRAE